VPLDRLLYGMSRERVLPEQLGKVHPVRRTPYVAILFTTALAFGLIAFVGKVPALGGTTALLLFGVFTVVNIAVLVLRRSPVDHEHFVAPTVFPVMGAFSCAYLASPLTDRDLIEYQIAGKLLLIGVVVWLLTRMLNRTLGTGGQTVAGTAQRICLSLLAQGPSAWSMGTSCPGGCEGGRRDGGRRGGRHPSA
jgi:basic amino acid/polyamine antiporter, APA family